MDARQLECGSCGSPLEGAVARPDPGKPTLLICEGCMSEMGMHPDVARYSGLRHDTPPRGSSGITELY